MKAININIDPYLQAVADWLNAGKPGTAPSFDPLPVAVTIPLGESAGIFFVGGGDKLDDPGNDPGTATIGEASITFWTLADDGIPETAVATNVVSGLSALAPETKYWLEAVTGDTSFSVYITDSDDDAITVTIPVLVQFEKSSGPVDLVDFTPPLSGQCLDGAWFNAGELRVLKSGETDLSRVLLTEASGIGGTDVLTASTPGS